MFMPDRASACALLAFRAAHGRHWKAKLLSLWSTGRDVDEMALTYGIFATRPVPPGSAS